MKRCLHNKKGLKPEPGAYIVLPNEGNCHECKFDPENNKNCRRFYPINLETYCVIKGPTATMFTNNDEDWRGIIKDIIGPP